VSKTCYNCGTENAEVSQFCRDCGADLRGVGSLNRAGVQGGRPQERVLWDNGHIQVTTEAVLIGMNTDEPDVVPLDTIYEVKVEEGCVHLLVKDGDDQQCVLDNPEELADLVRDQMCRPRLSQQRQHPDDRARPAAEPGHEE